MTIINRPKKCKEKTKEKERIKKEKKERTRKKETRERKTEKKKESKKKERKKEKLCSRVRECVRLDVTGIVSSTVGPSEPSSLGGWNQKVC